MKNSPWATFTTRMTPKTKERPRRRQRQHKGRDRAFQEREEEMGPKVMCRPRLTIASRKARVARLPGTHEHHAVTSATRKAPCSWVPDSATDVAAPG